VAVGAFPGDGQKLRRAVAVAHRRAQGLRHARTHGGAQMFAAGQHMARRDVQAPGGGLVGQQGGGGRVGDQDGELKVVQRRHQFMHRAEQVEAARQ